ncbi:hypothetical protein A9Q89_08805 [Gammaproteobacteria bacterium 53_120_T64]|nr:hypothetical protein A9Q89_08805 [Gammaproteobacteria bacterium 53_120_T64]
MITCWLLFFTGNRALAWTAVTIPLAKDFAADGEIVCDIEGILLLYFSAADCRYCMKLEEAVLKPMLRSGDYDQQVLLRKIAWRSQALVSDFSGRGVSLQGLAQRYDVKVTPTLVFVDSIGRELAPRILGFQSADFFWYYLDRGINHSIAIRRRATCANAKSSIGARLEPRLSGVT